MIDFFTKCFSSSNYSKYVAAARNLSKWGNAKAAFILFTSCLVQCIGDLGGEVIRGAGPVSEISFWLRSQLVREP